MSTTQYAQQDINKKRATCQSQQLLIATVLRTVDLTLDYLTKKTHTGEVIGQIQVMIDQLCSVMLHYVMQPPAVSNAKDEVTTYYNANARCAKIKAMLLM